MQTKVETSLQVRPRDALQLAFQVASAEVLRIIPYVYFQVTMEFDPRTASRNAPEFAVRFVPETGSGATFRTTPGTVPGTVRGVTRGMSI